MAEIRWTEEASDSLRHIHEYISEKNSEAAHTVVLGIYKKIQILSEFPKIGHLYQMENEKEIRTLLYGHYKIAYLILDEETVEIVGVAHGSMPIDRWLKRKE
jgi:plasmid stabilization system protein ParE